MTWWHLRGNGRKRSSVEVSEKDAATLMESGELVTTNPFEAANWED